MQELDLGFYVFEDFEEIKIIQVSDKIAKRVSMARGVHGYRGNWIEVEELYSELDNDEFSDLLGDDAFYLQGYPSGPPVGLLVFRGKMIWHNSDEEVSVEASSLSYGPTVFRDIPSGTFIMAISHD